MKTERNLDEVESALKKAFPECVVIQWVAMVEIFHPEGDKDLVRLTSEDNTQWSVEGLLSYGAEMPWDDDDDWPP